MLKYQVYYGRGLARGWTTIGELKTSTEELTNHYQQEYDNGGTITAIKVVDSETRKPVYEKHFEQINETKQERTTTMKYYEKKGRISP